MIRHGAVTFFAVLLSGVYANAADQTQIGAGIARAQQIGSASALVESAVDLLARNAGRIEDPHLRAVTLDSFLNANTCIRHRANVTDAVKNQIIASLLSQNLVNPADAASITGGVKAGVFPPVIGDGSACPTLPMTFNATPGSNFGGHHSYPGGLAVHESFNDQSSINFADTYRGEYGITGRHNLPIATGISRVADININQDVVLAAPIWHDWGKMMVFQWNADGTEFTELNFGGSGTNDNFGGTPGDSRTGGHHIISIAETMARGLTPLLVITQASAHSAPTLGNEFKVVNWLRAAAILAQIDPVAKGYLVVDNGQLRLPPLAALGSGVDLPRAGQGNVLVEYQIHNLSDSDFVNSIPAVTQVQVLLAQVAPQFGFNPSDVSRYNNFFRNVVLSNLSPERLMMIYDKQGIGEFVEEISKLRRLHLI